MSLRNAKLSNAKSRITKSRIAKSPDTPSRNAASFRISGQNLDLGDALRERIGERIAEATNKYFDGGYSGHVTLVRDGFGFRAECAIHLDSKITLHAEGMAQDAYASADQVAVRIEKRLRRYPPPAQGSSSRTRARACRSGRLCDRCARARGRSRY